MDTGKILTDFSKSLGKPFYDEERYYRESESVFKAIYNLYVDKYDLLKQTAETNVVTSAFSLLPASLNNLDYYSPFHNDLYVWGAKRGRMAKIITPNSRIGSEYLYNKNGDLICVKTYPSPNQCNLFTHHTFIEYKTSERKVLALDYNLHQKTTYELSTISLFTYDDNNKMVLAETCNYAWRFSHNDFQLYTKMWDGVAPVEFEIEMDGYDNSGQLLTIVSASYSPVIDGFEDIFEFLKDKVVSLRAFPVKAMIRDDDGYLSKYESHGVEYSILGSKSRKIRDVPQLPNLDRIFANQS